MDTYEKKYKDLLERARKQRDENCDGCKMCLESLFDELKESEDERIKNRLIKLIKMSSEVGGFALHKWEADEMVAWLEKQGEHHIACSEEQMKVLDEVLNFAANHESPYWNNYIFETLNGLIRQLKN